MKFNELNLMEPLQKAVAEMGYEQPSPIQEGAIPPALEGRDILGCAQTGTGKTAAFGLPIIQQLAQKPKESGRPQIKALIMTPTRELAMQIYENLEMYAKYTNIKSAVVFGGVSQKPQEEILRRGVDILVATPGRLNDLINQKIIHLTKVEILVLDEADRMLDMGFIHDVKKIIALVPKQRQTLFFSATMPDEITKLVNSILRNPVKIAVTPVSSTVDKIEQFLYFVDRDNKRKLLAHLLQDKSISSVLVFTRTKHGADRVAKDLTAANIKTMAIHGNKSQNARQNALSQFKTGEIRVLVATDIAARGIDVDKLSHVINFDLSDVPETYVHRIGRTGRAGEGGTAISFCDFDDKENLEDIQKLIKKDIKLITDHPYPMEVFVKREKQARTPRQPRQAKPMNTEKDGKKHVPPKAKTQYQKWTNAKSDTRRK